MGKLNLLYNTYAVADIIIDFKNGNRAYAFHYKPKDIVNQKIIFSYREALAKGNGGAEYFNELSRLEVKQDPDENADSFINVEMVYGMINIGYTKCYKNNKASPQYDRIEIENAYNFNYNDMEICYVNKPPHKEFENELEALAKTDVLDPAEGKERSSFGMGT